MSSTTSPISSGPTKGGTHNASLVHRLRRHSLYAVVIHTRTVDEIEFQCCLARSVIPNNGVMRCLRTVNLYGGLKGNMIYFAENGEQLPGTEE